MLLSRHLTQASSKRSIWHRIFSRILLFFLENASFHVISITITRHSISIIKEVNGSRASQVTTALLCCSFSSKIYMHFLKVEK
jgi:hypothetical protein